MTAQNDASPTPAEEGEPTQVLAPADAHGTTQRLGPVDGHAPNDEPSRTDSEYSATVLASHWIQRPETDDTLVEQPSTETVSARPDRVEGTVLRFGPGVTAAIAHRTLRTLPTMSSPPAPPRRRLRKHVLPALVVLAVLALLAWQRSGQSVVVDRVAATARPTVLGCDDTADVVGLVTTNGRAGTLTYRWVRSDGTASGVLREVMVRGQTQAHLHLRWTYRGKGHRTAQAELRILTPVHRAVTTHFTYDCP
ncbi:hypothetical protein ACIBL8_34545 [Streptomyces sp. NPDC050523]|uniref:hypothetical protein n=1 Tax=Streptomyces sp. NPDC050523 TaxID=3365622 RepID=UPI00378E544E